MSIREEAMPLSRVRFLSFSFMLRDCFISFAPGQLRLRVMESSEAFSAFQVAPDE